jgi:hypothetical protein
LLVVSPTRRFADSFNDENLTLIFQSLFPKEVIQAYRNESRATGSTFVGPIKVEVSMGLELKFCVWMKDTKSELHQRWLT